MVINRTTDTRSVTIQIKFSTILKKTECVMLPITRGILHRYCKASLPTSDLKRPFPPSRNFSGIMEKNLSVTATSSSGNYTPFLFNLKVFKNFTALYPAKKVYHPRQFLSRAVKHNLYFIIF